MKTQQISNQNFNGRLIFVRNAKNSYKYTDRIEQFFPKDAKPVLDEANKKLEKEPFDIFISKNKQKQDFYELYADKSHANIVNGKGAKPTLIHKSVVIGLFDSAVENAIDNFKKIF